MINEVANISSRCNLTESKCDSLKLNVDLMTAKFEETDSYVMKIEKHINQIKDDIFNLSEQKLDKSQINLKYEMLEDGIESLDRSMEIYDNRIKFLENFIDKYVPIQVQAMITESLKPIIQSETQMKKYQKHLQKEMNNFHEKILNDEGVCNIEISMELLGGAMANITKKSHKVPKFKVEASHSSQSLHKQSQFATKSVNKMETVDLINNAISEKSESDSEQNSQNANSPGKNYDGKRIFVFVINDD